MRGRKPNARPTVYTRGGAEYLRVRRQGQDRWVKLGPAGSAEAKQAYHRLCMEIATNGNVLPDPAGVTVAEAAAAYLDARKPVDRQPNFYRRTRMIGTVSGLYGLEPLTAFGPVALTACRQAWIAEGLGRRYVLALVRDVRHWLRWCSSRELVPPGYAERLGEIDRLRRNEGPAAPCPVRPADLDLVEQTLPHLTPTVADLARFQLLTGCRPGEACALRPGDLDRRWRQEGGCWIWLYRLDEHKNDWRGLLRWIPVGPRAQAVLHPYLDRDEQKYCFLHRGRPINTQLYGNLVRRCCDRHGLPRWQPNMLRHRAATDAERRFGRTAAQSLLGHNNPSTTSLYVEQVEHAAAVVAAVG